MAFIKPARQPWQCSDFGLQRARPPATDPALLHVLKTTCLVESRADDYADYLRAVFAPRGLEWIRAIDQWNLEERRHGLLLRAMAEAAQPGFDFEAAMEAYRDAVDYHPCDGRSVRGSIAAELLSRCVVEALATTFYRVLHDAVADQTWRAGFAALAQDEARHYGMFDAMLACEHRQGRRLGTLRRLWIAARRMLELDDEQICGASAVVGGRSAHAPALRREALRYAAQLYPLYRFGHLQHAARLLGRSLFGRQRGLRVQLLAGLLWAGLRGKQWLARMRLARAAGRTHGRAAERPALA